MEFEQACAEMNFILKHFDPNDLKVIPKYFLNFFEENMDKSYEVKIQEDKPLYEQDLKEETKAFIKILYITYFSNNKEEKERLMKEFETNLPKLQIKENIFENSQTLNIENQKEQTQIVVINKENKFIRLLKGIINKILGK